MFNSIIQDLCLCFKVYEKILEKDACGFNRHMLHINSIICARSLQQGAR